MVKVTSDFKSSIHAVNNDLLLEYVRKSQTKLYLKHGYIGRIQCFLYQWICSLKCIIDSPFFQWTGFASFFQSGHVFSHGFSAWKPQFLPLKFGRNWKMGWNSVSVLFHLRFLFIFFSNVTKLLNHIKIYFQDMLDIWLLGHLHFLLNVYF